VQNFIVSAVKTCKQCLQTALAQRHTHRTSTGVHGVRTPPVFGRVASTYMWTPLEFVPPPLELGPYGGIENMYYYQVASLSLEAQWPIVIKLSGGRSVGLCVGLSSTLWKNGGSDPDAVWRHRSDVSRDEADDGV